jgi:hypothetical protein
MRRRLMIRRGLAADGELEPRAGQAGRDSTMLGHFGSHVLSQFNVLSFWGMQSIVPLK